MCAVSVILDYGSQIPSLSWTRPGLNRYKDLVKEAEAFDATTGQPNCDDPEKADWLKGVEERLARLEAEYGEEG